MTTHIVTSKVVKVSVGGSTGNRVARVLFTGDVVPEGVADEQLARLIDRGLIAVVVEEQEQPTEVSLPEGAPTEKWTAPQLKKYAADNGIDLGEAKKKDDVWTVIAAAIAQTPATPPAPPAGD